MNRPRIARIWWIQADKTKKIQLFQPNPRNPRPIFLVSPTSC